MTWVLVVGAWVALGLLAALLIGRMIHRADAEEARSPECRPPGTDGPRSALPASAVPRPRVPPDRPVAEPHPSE
jgi:hypothetical protein